MPVSTLSLTNVASGWSVTSFSTQAAAMSTDGVAGTTAKLFLAPKFEDGAPALYQFSDSIAGDSVGLAFSQVSVNIVNASGATFNDFVVDLLRPPVAGNAAPFTHPSYSHFHVATSGSVVTDTFTETGYKVEYPTNGTSVTPALLSRTSFDAGNRTVLGNDPVASGTSETWDSGRIHNIDGTFQMIVQPLEQANFAAASGVDFRTQTFIAKYEHFNPVVSGTTANDWMYGSDTSANTMYGYGGNDVITSTGGNDTLWGGDGVDRLFGGSGNDTVNGEAGNDWLDGGVGDDVLDGGAGSNRLIGGAGIDQATYATALQSVTVDLGAGTGGAWFGPGDTLRSIENVRGSIHSDSLYGNSVANKLQGGAGNDYLSGGDGNDILSGEENDDTHYGGAGNDTFYGGSGNDFLSGESGTDTLRGESGNDTLIGGSGKDNLYGGSGTDRFEFQSASGAGLGASRDIIYDFRQDAKDRIDLGLIDAKGSVAGDQAFSFIGTKAFTAAGQLRANDLGTTVILQGSTDSDKAAEFEIEVRNFSGTFSAANDFFL